LAETWEGVNSRPALTNAPEYRERIRKVWLWSEWIGAWAADAGIDLVARQPVTGTGFGDLSKETSEWYAVQAPWLKDYERLLPSNEWLLHAAASGLPGAVAFTVAVMLPLFRNRKSLMWVGFHVVALVGFLYEIGLETQYGVLLYVFVASWMVAQDDRLTPGDAHAWNA